MSLINFTGYDNAPPPTPRRRWRPWLFGCLGAVILIAAALLVRPQGGDSLQSDPSPAADPALDLAFAQVRQQGVCLDGLAPTPDGWAQGFVTDIRTTVAHLADWITDPDNPENDGSGKPAEGLNLWVKAVYTNSLSTDNQQYTAHVSVGSVAALSTPLPLQTDENDAAYTRWRKAFLQVVEERKRAKTAVAQGEAALAALQFPPHDSTFSGISGCISGLLNNVPVVVDPNTHRNASRSFLIATDCNEPVAPQLVGNFSGDTLYVVPSCVSGDAQQCDSYFQQFSDRMRQLHVGEIVKIPADRAHEAIATWVKTGRWQP